MDKERGAAKEQTTSLLKQVQKKRRKETDIICPRSNSMKTISNAKVKTVKLTVVVVLGYTLCSAPWTIVQLYMVLGNPSIAMSKSTSIATAYKTFNVPILTRTNQSIDEDKWLN